MAISEAEKRAKTKYMKKVRQVMVKFNLATDEGDLFQHVEARTNMQGYIKDLIRKDMEGKVDWT